MAKTAGLSASQLRLLGELKRRGSLQDFYLAGGSAVGWHCGHRTSADLDLFSTAKSTDLAAATEDLTDSSTEWARIKTWFSAQSRQLLSK